MLLIAPLVMAGVAAQDLPPVSAASDFAHLNHGITPPKLVHSVDPEYSQPAAAAQIEGTVVLQAIIGVNGSVTHASVLCPLPGGLDQKALQAIKRWRYQPASMDTVIIPVLTTVDVVFRLPYQTSRPAPVPLQEANADVQLAVARRFEKEHNVVDAMYYYRLCAAAGNSSCQYGLGRLLVSGSDTNPNDFTQGIAWLELAEAHCNRQAAALLPSAAAKLSSIQLDWVAQLKAHMEPRRHSATLNY